MTSSSNCYSSLYPFPIDLNEDDQHQQHHQLFSLKSQPFPSSSSSSLTYPIFVNPTVAEQAGCYPSEPQQFQLDKKDQAKLYVLPYDVPLESDSGLKLPIQKKEERADQSSTTHQSHENCSARWMMRKVMSSDHMDLLKNSNPKTQDQKLQQRPSSSSADNNNNNNTIRVCADCNTTKTPLWRSGPRGPKSLCNACGIRQRKARRAMAAEAAAAAASGTIVAISDNNETTQPPSNVKSKIQHSKTKRSSSGCVAQFKKMVKKCNLSSQSQGRISKMTCLEDLRIILSKNLDGFDHQVFPQDEKEAAILLMALSYGLVHS